MGLLQDPIKSLEQVEWYLEHREGEKFPGALELAAGNLCRQTLEQILFILCFFGGVPRSRYFREDRTLRTAHQLIAVLDQHDPLTKMTFWELSRRRGPRIRKFAKFPRVLKAWQRKLNEPSHFSAKFRTIDEPWLRTFVGQVRKWFDDKDKYLIVAAVNELLSNGRIQAVLSAGPDNLPGVESKVVVGPGNLERDERGKLSLCSPRQEILVISDTEIPRGPWPNKLVLVQHTVGMSIGAQFVTKRGDAVNITSMETVIRSLAKTRGQRAALTRRLRKLGIEIAWRKLRSSNFQRGLTERDSAKTQTRIKNRS